MTLPTCVACGCAVDYLRSCYRSRFVYGPQSTQWLEAAYYWVSDETPMVPGRNIYSSPTWLPREEQDPVRGMQNKFMRWTNGSPPNQEVYDDPRIVAGLKDCSLESDGSYKMSPDVNGSYPSCCAQTSLPPEEPRYGPYSYNVEIIDLVVEGGLPTSRYFSLDWYEDHWADTSFEPVIRCRLEALEEYPDGQGFRLTWTEPYSDPPGFQCTWILLLGKFQGDTTFQIWPDVQPPYVLESFGHGRIMFVPREFPYQANPADVFPDAP